MRHYTSRLKYMENLSIPEIFEYLKWAEGKGYKETAALIRAELNTRLYHRHGDTIGEHQGRFKLSKLRQIEESGVNPRTLYRRKRKRHDQAARSSTA